MTHKNQNILILTAYIALIIITNIMVLIVALVNPNILTDNALFVEIGSYINTIAMAGGAWYFLTKYTSIFEKDYKLFKSNLKRYIKYTIYTFLIIYTTSIFSAMLFDLIGVSDTSENQAALEAIVSSTILAKISLVIFTVILAPLIEEFVFRKAVFGFLEGMKPIVPIIVSGVIFGAIHVLFDDIVQIIPYLLSGIAISIMYYLADKNIIVVILGHALYNLVGVIIMFTI